MYKYIIYGLGGIVQKKVITDYIITGFPHKKKSVITKNINAIINNYKPSKIKTGKTGDVNSRRKQYLDYKYMFLLYSSKSISNVECLENYYTNYLIINHSNITANVRQGSAADMTTKKHSYALYLVTN